MPFKVSAIICVYNGQDYLERALRCVFEQDYPVHELIVVDDGSTDGTAAILEKHRNRLRIRRTKNLGIATARNVANEWVTGDLVAYLDHDDVWFPTKIRRQVEAFERYPDVGVVCCNFATRYALKNRQMVRHYSALRFQADLNFNEPLRGNVLGHLLNEHFVGTPSMAMVRQSVLERVGSFNPEYANSQDYEYWLRCARVTSFLILSDVLGYKYNHPKAISANPLRQYTFQNRILEHVVSEWKEDLRSRGLEYVAERAYASSCYFLGNLHFEKGNRAEAMRWYRRGLSAQPTAENFKLFCRTVLKKAVRIATFGLASRAFWKKLTSPNHRS